MGQPLTTIDDDAARFIRRQHVFFVATAPLAAGGHVNLSPKGLDSFAVLDPTTVAYLDFTGSGVETIAHLKENGRIVVMFCAFEGAAKILRLHGRGEVVEPGHDEFESLMSRLVTRLGPRPGVRGVIRVRVDRVATSCGWGVPLLEYKGERTQLEEWAEKKGPAGIAAYQRKNNLTSIDGLSGLSDPH